MRYIVLLVCFAYLAAAAIEKPLDHTEYIKYATQQLRDRYEPHAGSEDAPHKHILHKHAKLIHRNTQLHEAAHRHRVAITHTIKKMARAIKRGNASSWLSGGLLSVFVSIAFVMGVALTVVGQKLMNRKS